MFACATLNRDIADLDAVRTLFVDPDPRSIGSAWGAALRAAGKKSKHVTPSPAAETTETTETPRR